MPKAEVGSTKYLSNKLKQKGLGRLRWYCQICEKQCRDQNGFKMHTQSESHVRQMLIVGEDPKKYIDDFSNQFSKDFLQLLKTGHGEKKVQMNQFYQEYIANKEHIHMNATKWPSLTEYAKYLGREGICRVEENDKGIFISWIDDSPEALRRQEALRRKEAQMQGDEALEQRMIRDQIKRAQANLAERGQNDEQDDEERELKRQEGEKITLSFGAKQSSKPEAQDADSKAAATTADSATSEKEGEAAETKSEAPKASAFGGISMKLGSKPQTKNVFAQAKKNALGSGSKKSTFIEHPKKMSEAERIMKEEMEKKKRPRDAPGFSMPPGKKQRN